MPVGVTVARATANVSLSTCAALPDPLPTYEPFSQEQLQGGAILLHVAMLLYMFLALAIVCDDTSTASHRAR